MNSGGTVAASAESAATTSVCGGPSAGPSAVRTRWRPASTGESTSVSRLAGWNWTRRPSLRATGSAEPRAQPSGSVTLAVTRSDPGSAPFG